MHIFFTRLCTTVRVVFLPFLFCLSAWHPTSHTMGAMPGFENLSPEEMQMLEQELQAAAQQIDAYVNSLSPEEQAEFQRAVSEVEQMMSTMNEEELGQFFEQIIAAEMEQAEQQGLVPPQQPTQPQPAVLEHKATPVVSKVPLTSAEEKALALLTSIIEYTDSLTNKTDNIIEMERYFKNWVTKSKIAGVATGTRWEEEKNSIIDFRQRMSDLKKTDLKTGKYLFVEILIKNTALYNQLEQLNKQLELHEPQIIVAGFGIGALSKESKTALQQILSAYGSTLQATKPDIKKLFEEIGPELAKIKEEEKKLTEKAQTEAAKGRQVTPGRTAGAQPGGEYYGGGRGYEGQEYGGYPYGGDYGYGAPSAGKAAPTEKATKEKPGKESGKGGKGKGKKEESEEEKKEREEKEKKAKEAKAKGATAAGVPTTKAKPEEILACPADDGEQLHGKYDLIAMNYRYIADLLNDDKYPEKLDMEFLAKEPDPQLALYIFPGLERRLKRLNELVAEYMELAKNSKHEMQAKAATDRLAKLHAEQSGLAALGESLAKIFAPENNLEEMMNQVNDNARYAYFKDVSHDKKAITGGIGDETQEVDYLSAIKKQYPETDITSLRNIYSAWAQLSKLVPKIEKEKDKDKSSEKSEKTESEEAAKKEISDKPKPQTNTGPKKPLTMKR